MMSESNCKDLHTDLCKDDSVFDNDLIVRGRLPILTLLSGYLNKTNSFTE